MQGPRLNALRDRLDALREGRKVETGLVRRALAALRKGGAGAGLDGLRALDLEFDRAGVHTAADARLLRDLGRQQGRLGKLGEGLQDRARDALEAFEAAVDEAEQAFARGELAPGAVTRLEQDFVRLARAVKVADLFTAPAAPGEATPFELYTRARPDPTAPVSARLAAVEFLARRAEEETFDVGARRRDLDVAYELMLRVVATHKDDKNRLRRLRMEVSQARDSARATPVVRSAPDLVRHLRYAARKDPQAAWRSLRGLYERAVRAGDDDLAQAAWGAVEAALPKDRELALALERTERERLGVFQSPGGRPPTDTAAGAPLPPGARAGKQDEASELLAQLAFELDDERLETLELAAGCAQYFDVEDALSEDVVEADLGARRAVQRRVPYPTQSMTYEFTGKLSEISNFVIHHPQTVVHDLASNRQMVRAYLEEEPPPRPRRVKQTAVRVYVLDASGSMYGPRARFRDAILIAELNAMRARAKAGQPIDPLYFAYFNDAPSSLTRVETAADATRHLEQLFRGARAEGQTDITLAMVSAFDSIKAAQGVDPYLARATVVLVTDGEDAVDLELVRVTRKPFEGLDIALSFISLGEENPDLRTLVLEQRAKGTRAFYHHLTDAEIATARTDFDSTWRTLLPADLPPAANLLELLLPHLESLEAIAQRRESKAPARADAQFEGLFPAQPAPSPVQPPAALVQRLLDVLEAVGEAASLAPAEARAGECVALLTHLLSLYQVPLPAYLEALGADVPRLREQLERVRLLGRPFG